MTDKSIRDAISKVYKKVISEAVAVAPVPPVGARPRPAAPRPAAPAAPAPAQSSARNDDDSAASYWNKEAERNRAQGGKPISNEFNIFGSKPAAPAPAAPKPVAPKPAAPKAQTPQQKSPAQDYGSEKPLPNAAAIRSPAQDYGSERRLPNADAILGNRSETPAPAQRERFTQPPETVATPEDRARFQGRAAQPPETRASEADREAFRARVAGGTYSNPDAVEKESGPAKKKKMSESTLINSFLNLQTSGASNMFEAAKKLKGDQHKLDKNQNGKLDSQDFKMLRGEKMEEAKKADKDYDGDGKIESSKDEVWGSRFKAAKKAGKMDEASSSDPDFAAPRPDGTKKPTDIEFKPKPEEKKPEDKVPLPPKRPDSMKEEVSFSETELAHFEAVIARKDQKGKERGIGDTVDSADLTDEYMYEMAQRGVKAGTKRGSYKKKATDLSGKRVAGADAGTDESDKGIPHVLDQIRDNKENERGFKTITNPNSKPEAPVTKQIHRSELHSFYDDYHNTEKPADKEKKYSNFLGKHFGNEEPVRKTGISLGSMK